MRQTVAIFRRHPRGFTLIEIMIVVGIIVVLATITTIAGVAVKRSSQRKYTQATLHTLQGLWNDYLAAGNPDIPANLSVLNASLLDPTKAPPGTAKDSTNSYQSTYPASDIVRWVIALRSDPKGAAALKNLHTLNIYDPAGDLVDPNISPPTPNKYFLAIVDGWGNPIRYVPMNPRAAGDSANVTINTVVHQDGYFFSCGPDGVTSSVIYNAGSPPAPAIDDLHSTDSF